MIVFDNWVIRSEKKVLLRQFDNCVATLNVRGNLPEGWEWVMLVKNGQNMDLLPMERMIGGLETVLTAEHLAGSGSYCLQLRGKNGSVVRHTNMITLYVESSMSGDVQWPQLPAVFSEMERRVNERATRVEEYSSHPPVLGENSSWWVWDGTAYADTGKPSRGKEVQSVSFEPQNGRWVTTYTDGTATSLDGYDPADSTVWSIFRDNFNAYPVGENKFAENATGDWRISDTYADRAYHDVGGDGDDKYVIFRTTGDKTRVATTINHFFQGAYTLEFDYMSMTRGGAVTDFFEVWLLQTPEGTPFVDGPLRARVNFKGNHTIHVNQKYAPGVKDVVVTPQYPLTSNTWYRVKISVKVGKISMKIWKRGEPEPVEGAAGTVSLESEIITEAMVCGKREIRLTFGVMNAEPPTEEGWRMGLDNVKVYRDVTNKIREALYRYNGETLSTDDLYDGTGVYVDGSGQVQDLTTPPLYTGKTMSLNNLHEGEVEEA